MTGLISTFGGPYDKGMKPDENLSLYSENEHAVCDRWPDLFLPRSLDLTQGTSKRLRPDALYFAYRFGNQLSRDQMRRIPWILTNPVNRKCVLVRLVDWGPHVNTGRVFDISPRAAELLEVETDETLTGYPLNL
jgi:hypothetical protein